MEEETDGENIVVKPNLCSLSWDSGAAEDNGCC